TAGTLGMRYRTFLLLDLAGALLSAPISVWLGFRFGGEISRALSALKRFEHVLVALVLLFVAWTLFRWLWRRKGASVEARTRGAGVRPGQGDSSLTSIRPSSGRARAEPCRPPAVTCTSCSTRRHGTNRNRPAASVTASSGSSASAASAA